MKEDIMGKSKAIPFGRGEVPSVDQIVRAEIFNEMRGLRMLPILTCIRIIHYYF